MKKISRKAFLLGGATAAAAATAGACLCTKTGWATITGVGDTPCIDAADGNSVSIGVTTDLGGGLRLFDDANVINTGVDIIATKTVNTS